MPATPQPPVHHAERLIDPAPPTISGGRMRRKFAGRQGQEPVLAQLGDKIRGRHHERTPRRSPSRAAGEEPRIGSDQRVETSLEQLSHYVGPFEEPGRQHHVEDGVAVATASGSPAKVEPWVPATMPAVARSVARQALIGKLLLSALAIAMTSGGTSPIREQGARRSAPSRHTSS